MNNFERMIALADEFFDAKNDPDQIAVDEEVMERLRRLHPATLGEEADRDGPVAWMLLIPTTHQLMDRFLTKEIGERALLDLTEPGGRFEAVYLCSALVLPEYRGRGVAKRLAVRAVEAIMRDHPIRELFFWPFSVEGRGLAESVAAELKLPLLRREA